MEIQVKNLDNLGIVTGIIDKIGLVEEIYRQITKHLKQIMTTGVVVKYLTIAPIVCIKAQVARRDEAIQLARRRTIRFILATNVIDENILGNDDINFLSS